MASLACLPLMYGRSCGHTSVFNPKISSLSSCNISPSFFPLVQSTSSSTSSSSPSHLCTSFDSCGSGVSGVHNSWKLKRSKLYAVSMAHGESFPKSTIKSKVEPDHLLVLVHGILASPSDWTYFEVELKRRLGRNFLIHASSSNTYTKTFGGVDGAGRRLANEVMEVAKRTASLKKISFLSHSLGGLFSRYAVAVLYSADKVVVDEHPDTSKANNNKSKGKIAGLEAINFITLATPHLGVRGRKQLPFLFGVPILEKLAAPLAPVLVGRTGSQLFLTDGKPNKPPLLLRMTSDCEDWKFLSALGAFKSRTLYANISYDHMVGWRTSSIRRENELPKPPRKSLKGYKHVVNIEDCSSVSSGGPHFRPQDAKAKEAAQTSTSSTEDTIQYHEIMEEEMIQGLQRLEWKKVDVSFHSATWPFFAHNNIHVKSGWLHHAGAGVVSHVVDSLKQQESSSFFAARL